MKDALSTVMEDVPHRLMKAGGGLSGRLPKTL
jgi:hypothetical protein